MLQIRKINNIKNLFETARVSRIMNKGRSFFWVIQIYRRSVSRVEEKSNTKVVSFSLETLELNDEIRATK